MRAIVIANGVITGFYPHIFPDDIIIAVDGGLHYCLAQNLLPHKLIGDMDSLTPEEFEIINASNIPISRYPTQKEHTDLELALQAAVDTNAEEIILIGVLGGRWDMSIANVMLLASPILAGYRVHIQDNGLEISLIQSGEMKRFEGYVGDTLSLIPLRCDADNVWTTGLKYPLNGETLHFSATKGISNVFLEETATVSLENGLLLCVIQREHP